MNFKIKLDFQSRKIIYLSLFIYLKIILISCDSFSTKKKLNKRPNFLLLMSDNHSSNHLGCYGDKYVKTPNIDYLANEGVLFKNAFCSAPSCSPARAAMLSGKDIWQLGEAANLWSSFPKITVFTELLEESGYKVGIQGKGWGPGNYEISGWSRNPGGDKFNSFKEFVDELDANQPWMYKIIKEK